MSNSFKVLFTDGTLDVRVVAFVTEWTWP